MKMKKTNTKSSSITCSLFEENLFNAAFCSVMDEMGESEEIVSFSEEVREKMFKHLTECAYCTKKFLGFKISLREFIAAFCSVMDGVGEPKKAFSFSKEVRKKTFKYLVECASVRRSLLD